MRALLLTGTIIIAGLGVARAADMGLPLKASAPVAYSWTGCYVGPHAGWAVGNPSFRDASGDNVFDATGANVTGGLFDAASLQRSVSVQENGALLGGQVGCDYQFGGNYLVGISGSASGATMTGTHIDPFTDARGINPSTGTMTTKTDFLGDVSGRLGIIWGQALFYAKGGVAWSHHTYTADTCYCDSDSAQAFSATNTAFGAVAGVGSEWAFATNWSAFAQYDHYFFGNNRVNFVSPGIGFAFTAPLTAAVNVKQDIDAVMFGVNYRFR